MKLLDCYKDTGSFTLGIRWTNLANLNLFSIDILWWHLYWDTK